MRRILARALGASDVALGERIQTLWGGYGEIRRATLSGTATEHVVVKSVVPPELAASADSATARSHRRKLRSYEVERAFYQRYASRCGASCRVPVALHLSAENRGMLFVLGDLDAAGFSVRRDRPSEREIQACLQWLAAFHATFLNVSPESLWKVGSYWHLSTRPDELRALADLELRRAAPWLDEQLNRASFRTLIHGDAKLQNFCFTRDGSGAAAVDFQYVGGGVGVKDVAYFLTSCLTCDRLEREVPRYLDDYFRALREALSNRAAPASALEAFEPLESEWRALYPLACADFHRFLLGWAPEEAVRDRYLESVTQSVLDRR